MFLRIFLLVLLKDRFNFEYQLEKIVWMGYRKIVILII